MPRFDQPNLIFSPGGEKYRLFCVIKAKTRYCRLCNDVVQKAVLQLLNLKIAVLKRMSTKIQPSTGRFAMEKQIRIISKVFFFAVLNLLVLIFVSPLLAWSYQASQYPVWLNSTYQQVDNKIEKKNSAVIPFSVPSETPLTSNNKAAGQLEVGAAPNSGSKNLSALESSSNRDGQKLLLMLLLLASSNKMPGS